MKKACQASPHYHRPSDLVDASGHSIPMMTKCIQANVATLATLAGVNDPTSMITLANMNKSQSFTVFNKNNTIHITPIGDQLSGIIEISDLKGRIVYKNKISPDLYRSIKINSSAYAGGIVRMIIDKTATSAVFMLAR